jgi:hypothetical protein
VTRIAVIYHGGCTDGFGAAWAAWKRHGGAASYLPARYGEPLPDPGGAERVYLLDFSAPRAVLDALAGRHEVRLLDHHKTAAEALGDAPYATFDMHKSGAVLAWEHFHPAAAVPRLLAYVQDRDLWRFVLPHSREVSAALSSYPMQFEEWQALAERLDAEPQTIVAEGAAILRYLVQQTATVCDEAMWRAVGGHLVPVVNATNLASEVGEELLRRHPDAPFVASYYDTAQGYRKWSLRSRPGVDVSAIAQRFGGGGHAQAAGFEERLVIRDPQHA